MPDGACWRRPLHLGVFSGLKPGSPYSLVGYVTRVDQVLENAEALPIRNKMIKRFIQGNIIHEMNNNA